MRNCYLFSFLILISIASLNTEAANWKKIGPWGGSHKCLVADPLHGKYCLPMRKHIGIAVHLGTDSGLQTLIASPAFVPHHRKALCLINCVKNSRNVGSNTDRRVNSKVQCSPER